ncbi:L-threonylcarbamoyladenylate synthase [Lutibacter maritimus]|jgi:L-threonylcarbamoyladenylate synthase|uniref:L-threonylcarbamoyladenylate synthase n=1 Tax=Lutibacter maritimus TaxID=593133 RepID=A0A1I6NPH0_9FLAO|nr:L-threonylcarbamoyladenylate synthase [Lutibacter maritimus]SFS29783.1 L-threonylcarbamoyladenylate synthase [Lutibacter maritimus]
MKQEIEKSLKILQKKEILLYPTDTVWGIGCDATSEAAVSKIYTIKQRAESKSLIILVDEIEMLQQYIPTISKEIIALLSKTTNPTTIIYNNPIGLAKNVVAQDNTVAIRIVQNDFCKQLIAAFGKPIVSTSANISGNETPKSFKEIASPILESVDYVVNLHREERNEKSSTILKVAENGEIIVLRA